MINKYPIVRFAPSPTGFLHIGNARTALFNWLFAKSKGGKFLLRIEDTDKERSTKEAVDAIFNGLNWLGLDFDDEPVIQTERLERHKEIARELIDSGKAYKCYCSPEELDVIRENAKNEGKKVSYNRKCREIKNKNDDIPFTVRLKMPLSGKTTIKDMVQGEVSVENQQLDDMILLRSDGTPTYMLSVVVDDHDMNITHIIRGDDHLNNAFRQYQLYKALSWNVPEFAHIPLIHGSDGSKMSKRHGATTVADYSKDYLKESMRNYLLRLGWGKGDIEIISTDEVIKIFNIEDIGKSPSRFDFDKLKSFNAHYIKNSNDDYLVEIVKNYIEKYHNLKKIENLDNLKRGMSGLKLRAKTISELVNGSMIYLKDPDYSIENDNISNLITMENANMLHNLLNDICEIKEFNEENIELCIRNFSKTNDIKMKNIAQPLRLAISGSLISPSLFEVIKIIGKKSLEIRINNFINFINDSYKNKNQSFRQELK